MSYIDFQVQFAAFSKFIYDTVPEYNHHNEKKSYFIRSGDTFFEMTVHLTSVKIRNAWSGGAVDYTRVLATSTFYDVVDAEVFPTGFSPSQLVYSSHLKPQVYAEAGKVLDYPLSEEEYFQQSTLYDIPTVEDYERYISILDRSLGTLKVVTKAGTEDKEVLYDILCAMENFIRGDVSEREKCSIRLYI